MKTKQYRAIDIESQANVNRQRADSKNTRVYHPYKIKKVEIRMLNSKVMARHCTAQSESSLAALPNEDDNQRKTKRNARSINFPRKSRKGTCAYRHSSSAWKENQHEGEGRWDSYNAFAEGKEAACDWRLSSGF